MSGRVLLLLLIALILICSVFYVMRYTRKNVETFDSNSMPFIKVYDSDDGDRHATFVLPSNDKQYRFDELDMNDTYNYIELKGDATSVVVCKKDWKQTENGTEHCETINKDLAKSLHEIPYNNDLSSLKTFPENNPNAYVTLSGRRGNKPGRPDTLDVTFAQKLNWHKNITHIETGGNLKAVTVFKKKYARSDNRNDKTTYDAVGKSELPNQNPSKLKGRIESMVAESKDLGQFATSGIGETVGHGGGEVTTDLIERVDTTDSGGLDYIELYDERADKDKYLRFRPILDSEAQISIGHVNLEDTYNTIELKGTATKVKVCKNDWHNGNNTCKEYTREKDGPGLYENIFGQDEFKLSSLRRLEPANHPGAYVTLSNKKSSGKKKQPDEIDVIRADKLDWHNRASHISIKGNMTVEVSKNKTDGNGNFSTDESDKEVFTNTQARTLLSNNVRNDVESLRVTEYNTEELIMPTTEVSLEPNPKTLDWIEFEDDRRDEPEVIRFLPDEIRHLDLNDTYDRITLRGSTEAVKVCEKDWRETEGGTKHCRVISKDDADYNDDGVKIFPNRSHEISSLRIMEPENDPNAYVSLHGKKSSGRDMQPNNIGIMRADKLNWDDAVTHITMKGEIDVDMYQKKNLEDDYQRYKHGTNKRAVQGEHRPGEGEGDGYGSITTHHYNSAAADGEFDEQVDNPYVEFVDHNGDEGSERFRFKPTNLDTFDLDNTYNFITLKGGATRVAVCDQNWKQVGDYTTNTKCMTITNTSDEGQEIFEGRHDKLSSIRIIEPENDEEAYVTLSGRNPDKTDRPETIDVYRADKLSWRNNVDGINIHGSMQLDFYKDRYAEDGIPHPYTVSQDPFDGNPGYESMKVPLFIEKGDEIIGNTAVHIDEDEADSNLIDIILTDRTQQDGALGEDIDQYIHMYIRGEQFDMNMDNAYNTVTLSKNCAKALVCKEGYKNMIDESDCMDTRDGNSGRTIRGTNSKDTCDLCEIVTPYISQTGYEIRTKTVFNGEYEISYVKIWKTDENKPAFVRLSGTKRGGSVSKAINDAMGLGGGSAAEGYKTAAGSGAAVGAYAGAYLGGNVVAGAAVGAGIGAGSYALGGLFNKGPKAARLYPDWVDIVHADMLNWNRHYKAVRTNKSVFLYKERGFGGDVLHVKRRQDNGEMTIEPTKLVRSISIYPAYKVLPSELKPESRFISISDVEGNSAVIHPMFSDSVRSNEFKTFDFRRKYKRMRFMNGCTRVKVVYIKPTENTVPDYRHMEAGLPCDKTEGWDDIFDETECASGMSALDILHAETPTVRLDAPYGCSFNPSSANEEWYLNRTMNEGQPHPSDTMAMCKKLPMQYSVSEIILTENKEYDIVILFHDNIVSIEVLDDGDDYYIPGSGFVELYESIDDSIPPSLGVRNITSMYMSTNLYKLNVDDYEALYTREESVNTITKNTDFYVQREIDSLVVFAKKPVEFVTLILMKEYDESDDVMEFIPPKQIHNMNFMKDGQLVYKRFTFENGAKTVKLVLANGNVIMKKFDLEDPAPIIPRNTVKIEVIEDGLDNHYVGAGYVRLMRSTDRSVNNRPENLDIRRATRFNWSNIKKSTVEYAIAEEDEVFITPPSRRTVGVPPPIVGVDEENTVSSTPTSGSVPASGVSATPSSAASNTVSSTSVPASASASIQTNIDIDDTPIVEPFVVEEAEQSNVMYVRVKGHNRKIVFYGQTYGNSDKQYRIQSKFGFDERVPSDVMYSMYTDVHESFPTAFMKKTHGDPKKREYIQFIPDRDIRNLQMDNTYNQFEFKGGARKVQMCRKHWNEVKHDCYTKYGPAMCKECETYTWDPKDPDKVFNLSNELYDDLSSLRVYDDGYQGYDKHQGYVLLKGKRDGKDDQPNGLKVRSADRLDWNDDPDIIYTPDRSLTFYQGFNKNGDQYNHDKLDDVQMAHADGYSSMYRGSEQRCLNQNQECISCTDDSAYVCKGMYSSAAWRWKYFRDGAKDSNGGYDGKCVNNECVACESDYDCKDGYQCCLEGSCDKWTNNRVYGACHKVH